MAQRRARETLLQWAVANLNQVEMAEYISSIDTAWATPKIQCRDGHCQACAVALARKSGALFLESLGTLRYKECESDDCQ